MASQRPASVQRRQRLDVRHKLGRAGGRRAWNSGAWSLNVSRSGQEPARRSLDDAIAEAARRYPRRLEPSGPSSAFISETGVFRSVRDLTPATGVLPYDVNSPLWSDGAAKKRWLALPKDTQIGFAEHGAWKFPPGTVFVKHFDMPSGEEPGVSKARNTTPGRGPPRHWLRRNLQVASRRQRRRVVDRWPDGGNRPRRLETDLVVPQPQ